MKTTWGQGQCSHKITYINHPKRDPTNCAASADPIHVHFWEILGMYWGHI